MWNELRGAPKWFTGTSGTVTIPLGWAVLQIHAVPGGGGGTVLNNLTDDGAGNTPTVTLPAGTGWWGIQEQHTNMVSRTGHNTIVFTGTSAYLVECGAKVGASA